LFIFQERRLKEKNQGQQQQGQELGHNRRSRSRSREGSSYNLQLFCTQRRMTKREVDVQPVLVRGWGVVSLPPLN
jgi:hypothetical protein